MKESIIKELKYRKNLDGKETILYSDFESVVFNNKHYITCYSIVSIGKSPITRAIKDITEENIVTKSQSLLESYLKTCFEYSNSKSNYVLFHNLGRFDGFFLVNYCCQIGLHIDVIARNNVIYEISIRNNKKKFIFRDSYLLFPMPLERMANIFLGNENKKYFDYSKNVISSYSDDSFIEEIKQYCLQDVLILMKSFNEYLNYISKYFGISLISCLTLSSLAFKIFRTHFYDSKQFPIQHLNGNIESFVRQSYRGGIVDVYRPVLKNGYLYDVNSLYPYIMSKYEMPLTKINFIADCTDLNIDSFFGFLEVDVSSPEILYIPFLTLQDPNRGLISPLGTWSGIYFSEEIKYAMKLGYRFKFKKAFEFNKGIVFDKYVDSLYKKRIENKGNPLNYILKLILNSLYGRFGMSNNKEKTLFIKNDHLSGFLNIYDILSCDNLGEMEIIKINTVPNLERIKHSYLRKLISSEEYLKYEKANYNAYSSTNTAVQIASAVTAYARIEMHKLKTQYIENIYYSDTDSVFLDCKLPENLVSDTELGKIKLECKIKEALFVAPKLYYYITQDDFVVIKGKGIESDVLTIESIKNLYCERNNESFKIIRNFIRSFKNFSLSTKQFKMNISGKFDKREKVYEKGYWQNTSPIKIK